MTDLFSMLAASEGSEQSPYGMAGALKKTQYVLELVGQPHDPATLKCILTAAEQGMEMNCYGLNQAHNADLQQAITAISPFNITPCLREADYLVCGGTAITEFINARGLGYSLTPQNAMLAAIQNYWVDIASNHLDPLIRQRVNQHINASHEAQNYAVEEVVLEPLSQQISSYFALLDDQLKTNKFIVCNKYTWADLHWTVYVHLCEVMGCADLLSRHPNIQRWMEMIKGRKSSCGQDLVAYDLLPDKEQILKCELNSVEIIDY